MFAFEKAWSRMPTKQKVEEVSMGVILFATMVVVMFAPQIYAALSR